MWAHWASNTELSTPQNLQPWWISKSQSQQWSPKLRRPFLRACVFSKFFCNYFPTSSVMYASMHREQYLLWGRVPSLSHCHSEKNYTTTLGSDHPLWYTATTGMILSSFPQWVFPKVFVSTGLPCTVYSIHKLNIVYHPSTVLYELWINWGEVIHKFTGSPQRVHNELFGSNKHLHFQNSTTCDHM